MSRSDACIHVSCDECGVDEEMSLCALAGGGWDERYIDDELERNGWTCADGRDLCESCSQELTESLPVADAVDPSAADTGKPSTRD